MLLLPLNEKSPIILMVLAAGSTLAGNLLTFGSASNFIVIQNAEKKGGRFFLLHLCKVWDSLYDREYLCLLALFLIDEERLSFVQTVLVE